MAAFSLQYPPLQQILYPKTVQVHDNGRLKYLICTASLSSLFLQHNTVSAEKLVVEIHSILYALENVIEIHFSYVRGHCGNLGNERADQLAKQVMRCEVDLMMSAPASYWKHVTDEKTVSDWNTEFLASSKALWTKIFFLTIFQCLKYKHFLTEVLSGHEKLNNYLFRFHLETSGLRACIKADEDVEHILLHCKLHVSANCF